MAATQRPTLDAIAYVRLAPAEKRRLREQADGAGLTLSAYARRRMLGHVVVPAVDMQMIRELRRVGGLLKATHVQSQGAHQEETAAALREVRAAIAAIRTRTEAEASSPATAPDPGQNP